MSRIRDELERIFPGLASSTYSVSSQWTFDYNCFAWALDLDDRKVDPVSAWWPTGLPRELNLNAFTALFAREGYVECEGPELEPGYEKIAIFVDDFVPSHAARQLENGAWTSKLGDYEDIEHELLEAVGGTPGYGVVVRFMKRESLASPRAPSSTHPCKAHT